MLIRNRFAHACLLLAIAVFVLKADAVIATAEVTVNIVPLSSFLISKRLVLSMPADKDNAAYQQKRVELNTLSYRLPLKVHFHGAHNALYDISISSRSILTGAFSADRIAIDNMKLTNTSSHITDNEQQLQLDGLLTKPSGRSTDAYTGTAEITINYN